MADGSGRPRPLTMPAAVKRLVRRESQGAEQKHWDGEGSRGRFIFEGEDRLTGDCGLEEKMGAATRSDTQRVQARRGG